MKCAPVGSPFGVGSIGTDIAGWPVALASIVNAVHRRRVLEAGPAVEAGTLDVPRIRVHDLRHTHATLALEAGIQPS